MVNAISKVDVFVICSLLVGPEQGWSKEHGTKFQGDIDVGLTVSEVLVLRGSSERCCDSVSLASLASSWGSL